MLPKLLLIANGQMVWRAAIAGLCGSVTHTLLMLGKAKLGILEPFQPYQSLQIALSYWSGEYVHPLLPWGTFLCQWLVASRFCFCRSLLASTGRERSR
jgi:hypothetical protein